MKKEITGLAAVLMCFFSAVCATAQVPNMTEAYKMGLGLNDAIGSKSKTEKTRIKKNGRGFRIYTKAYPKEIMQSIFSEDDNYPKIVFDAQSAGLLDIWQFVGFNSEKDPDLDRFDYTYIVSGFSGLNIQVPNASTAETHMELAKHKDNRVGNEIFAFEPVPGEEGWFLIRNHNSNRYLRYDGNNCRSSWANKMLWTEFKMVPKHNPMVIRVNDNSAQMVYDVLAPASNDDFSERAFTLSAGNPGTPTRIVTANGKVMLTVSGPIAAGSRIASAPNNNTTIDANQFKVLAVGENLYKVVSAKDTTLCMEVIGAAKGNKSPLALAKYAGAAHQQFYMRYTAVPWLFQGTKDKSKTDDTYKFRIEEAEDVNWNGRN